MIINGRKNKRKMREESNLTERDTRMQVTYNNMGRNPSESLSMHIENLIGKALGIHCDRIMASRVYKISLFIKSLIHAARPRAPFSVCCHHWSKSWWNYQRGKCIERIQNHCCSKWIHYRCDNSSCHYCWSNGRKKRHWN